MFLIVATFIFFTLSTCIHTYSSIADFVNNYTFASNQEKENPQVFMATLNESLKDLTLNDKIAAILEQDVNGNNGIMAFIKHEIYAGQNGKNLLQLLNCLPNEIDLLKKALTSVNNDNQSALSLAFIHYTGAMSTLSALWEKMEKIPNYVLLFQEKDKNEHNFIFKALIENIPRFFDGYGYGFHNLVFKDANLTKNLLLEKCPMILKDKKKLQMNVLIYALLQQNENFLFKIFEIFIEDGKNYKKVSEIKEILKTIVLHHDENNENLLMYAFMYEASPDLIKLFLSNISDYDELVTLLFTKENKKKFWAFSLAFKNKNYLFLIFQALYCLAKNKEIDFTTNLNGSMVINLLKLFVIEKKLSEHYEQLLLAAAALLHGSTNIEIKEFKEKLHIIVHPFSNWATQNQENLDQLSTEQRINLLESVAINELPSFLQTKLEKLRTMLALLKEKLTQLKERLSNLAQALGAS